LSASSSARAGSVVFTGFISDADKPAYFTTADVYCAPNTGNESQGIVLLEAMASGTPVAASDIPGFRSVITSNETGVLAAPRDAERLAWAICHLLRDDAARRVLAARGQARAQDFGWESVTNRIEGVYHEAYRRLHERQATQRWWRSLLHWPAPVATVQGGKGQSVWAISSLDENVVE
jgi:glycosyltransferase involved in cell wall biosynthesis